MTPASLTLTFLPADTRWGLPDPGYLPCSDRPSSAGFLPDLLPCSPCVPSVPGLSSVALSTISGPESGWLCF